MDGQVTFGVLGPVTAWDAAGSEPDLKGPRHRAVLARLVVARRHVVPLDVLVHDLWDEPGPGAVSAVQTFVAALRRALEPDRAPRTAARLLVSQGTGYALRADRDAVDAWRFETALTDAAAAVKVDPGHALDLLDAAVDLWRGPAYAAFVGEHWARGECRRLEELRLRAVEQRAEALLALGRAAQTVPALEAHAADHPWREETWRLLALALYRTGRQGDALAVLRRAGEILREELGIDPSTRLRRLEHDILAQDPALDQDAAQDRNPPSHPTPAPTHRPDTSPALRLDTPPTHRLGTAPTHRPDIAPARPLGTAPAGATPSSAGATPLSAEASSSSGEAPSLGGDAGGGGLQRATEAFERAVGPGARARLESTVGVLRALAMTGGTGLAAARAQRLDAITAAEAYGDAELTARVIGAYDVPAIWPRSDDPAHAARLVAAAEGALAALSDEPGANAVRCRLSATIALEMRGTRDPRGPQAARLAEDLARRLGDPALLAFALNGSFMQSCTRTGLAPRRDAIGAELIELSTRHGLENHLVLGHLIRLQARAALADFGAADEHADTVDHLAKRHERPLVSVFTTWYRALRLAAEPGRDTERAEDAYRAAAETLDGAEMPGVQAGLLPLALLSVHMSPTRASVVAAVERLDPDADFGPYLPWIKPLLLLKSGRRGDAVNALRSAPEPPADLMCEAMYTLQAAAALELEDELEDEFEPDLEERVVLRRVRQALLPATGELAGAASGLITFGPVSSWIEAIPPAAD